MWWFMTCLGTVPVLRCIMARLRMAKHLGSSQQFEMVPAQLCHVLVSLAPRKWHPEAMPCSIHQAQHRHRRDLAAGTSAHRPADQVHKQP